MLRTNCNFCVKTILDIFKLNAIYLQFLGIMGVRRKLQIAEPEELVITEIPRFVY